MHDSNPRVQSIHAFLASFGLRDSETRDWRGVPRETWDSVLSVIGRQRLSGLAVAALEAGSLTLSQDQSLALLHQQEAAMMHALNIERHLLELVAALRTQGIESVVLKGSALANTVYPDPSWRPFGDLDLLVRTRQWSRSCDVLIKLGHRREFLEPRAGFSARFGRTALHVSESGLEVDLHRGLASGPFLFWVREEDLFRHPTEFELGGVTLSRLDDSVALLHACMHASLGSRPPLLMPLRDVAQVAASGRIDWEAVRSLAEAWKLRAVVRHALQTTSAALDVDLPREARVLARSLSPSKKEREALAAFTTDRRNRGARALWAFRATPGVWRKAAFARAMLLPNRAFLASSAAHEHPSYGERWKLAVKSFKGKSRREHRSWS